MQHEFPYLKKHSSLRFQKVFKRILWNKVLTAGEKVFAFSLLTVPAQSTVRLKKLARKLGSAPEVISRWHKGLKENGSMPRTIERLSNVPYEMKAFDRRFRN